MAEELTQEAIDLGYRAVEQTVESGNGKWFFYGIIVGANLGLAAGYFGTKKRLETKYAKISEDEIKEMREHYLAKEKAAQEKKPLDEVMEEHGYKTKLEGPDETVYVRVQPKEVEVEPEREAKPWSYRDEWDYAAEELSRIEDPDKHVPYVLHKDEFMANERGYNQITVTYYEGDDVLCDERDAVVDDQDATIGLGNLSKFGHGSGDVNVVYVRNVELEIEYEIVHSDGKYAVEVHGFSEDELKHSSRIHRRHRGFDDE